MKRCKYTMVRYSKTIFTVNYTNIFAFSLILGKSNKNIFGVNHTHTFCKLNHFINISNIYGIAMKSHNLWKRVSKFMPKKFYEIDPLIKIWINLWTKMFYQICLWRCNQCKIRINSKQNQSRGQCYKTFCCGNLLSFHGNTIILCYKAILPW